MTKKLLLTTALISALSSGTTAYATDFEIAYNGNNTYIFDGANYASLTLLGQEFDTRIHDGRIVIGKDDVKIKKDTQKTFIVDLISNKNNVRDQFSLLAAAISGHNPAEVSQYLNEFARVVSLLPVDQQNELLDTIDLDDIGEFDEEELQDQLVYLEKAVNEKESTKLTESNFSTIESKLSSENSSIRTLLEERDNLLTAATTLSAEQAAKLDSLSKQLGSLKEFVEIRNAKETQENLKQRIALIELAVSSNENSALNTKAVADLNQLKKDIDKYLVRSITDTTTLPNVQKSDTAVSEGLMNSLVISRGVVDSRISGFSAVSAGDLMQAYGIWAQGSMSRGTQKAYGNAPGYKLDQKGITIGADTGDETLLGLAYSFFMNDIKNKANSSNKEDIKSHIVTVYGKFDVTNEVFVSGQAQYGKANIKKKRATGDLANNIASAKTNATSMAAKL
jgi:3-methyladenine DNA glycosylase Tag